MLNTNVCEAFENYPQYVASNSKGYLSECRSISDGILVKGF